MRRLHHFPLSPVCRRIRLSLSEKRLTTDLAEERPWGAGATLRALNPSGETPILVEPSGLVVAEGYAITEYLEETYPDIPLLPEGRAERAEARRLTGWFDGQFRREATAPLLGERVLKQLRGEGQPDSVAVRQGLSSIRAHLDHIGWLADHRRWLAGDALSIADFAAAGHLSALDYAGLVPWEISEPATQWYRRIKSRPAFRVLLADRLPEIPPVAHYADLDF